MRCHVLVGLLLGVACAHAEPPIRSVSAPQIRSVSAPTIRVASAAKVAPPKPEPSPAAQLPAPHKAGKQDAAPAIHALIDLRKLVGRRDKHEPSAVALAWARDVGTAIEVNDGPSLVKWARAHGRLVPGEDAEPGDLLVFDHIDSDVESDLVALAIARDNRNVVEFMYAGGGVIRRGFCDAKHPSVKRDHGIVVNTYMRTGDRYPPKATHYLAGELLGHVVRVR